MSSFNRILRLLEKLRSERRHFLRQEKEEKLRLLKARRNLRTVKEATAVVQELARNAQETAHSQIASVVNRCLAAVWEDPYEFRILFEKKRNRTEARLAFFQDGEELDPRAGVGGSVLQVAAFALRVACLALTRPHARRFIVMDEPFGGIDKKNAPRIKAMVEGLSKEMNIQFLIVTHNPNLVCGKVIELEK